MGGLPPVEQDFEANASEYIAVLDAIIAKSDEAAAATTGLLGAMRLVQEQADAMAAAAEEAAAAEGALAEETRAAAEAALEEAAAAAAASREQHEQAGSAAAAAAAEELLAEMSRAAAEAALEDAAAAAAAASSAASLREALVGEVASAEAARAVLDELGVTEERLAAMADIAAEAQQRLSGDVLEVAAAEAAATAATNDFAAAEVRLAAAEEAARAAILANAGALAEQALAAHLAAQDQGRLAEAAALLGVSEAELGDQFAKAAAGADEQAGGLYKTAEAAQLLGVSLGAMGSALTATKAAEADAAAATSTLGTKLAGMLTLGKLFQGGIWSFAAWHYIVDGAIEVGIALASAAIAITAFGIAGARTADAILTHFQAIIPVMAATGQAIAPLTQHLNQLSTALAPDVLQIYGDALQVVTAKTGAFADMAKSAGSILDQFAARAEMAIQRSGAADEFAAHAATFLNGVLQLLANIMGVLGNLFRAAMETHIAEYLLTFAQAAAKVLEVVTSIPTPLLAIVVGLHGLWLWGRLAGAAFGSIANYASGLATSLIGLGVKFGFVGDGAIAMAGKLGASEEAMAAMGTAAEGTSAETGLLAGSMNLLKAVPVWGWVAAGVIALGVLVYALSRVQNATQQWISSLQATVDKATMVTGLNVLAGAIGEVGTRLRSANDVLAQTPKLMVNLHTGASEVTNAYAEQAQKAYALTAAQQELRAEDMLAIGRLTTLAVKYGGLGQAIGLASLAGIKWSTFLHGSSSDMATADQQIAALVEGYRMMGQSGSAVANDANAMTFAIELQDSKVAQLNQAWQTFIGTVTGGETSFVGFEQQMQTTATAAKAAGASFNGLSANSLTLRSDFQQTVGSASTLLQSIATMGSAMANGAHGEQLVGQASRDLVANLIPLGAKSAYVRSEIYALAQEAGYTGADSLKKMSQWAGTSAGSAQRLSRVLGQLTVESSGLTRDVNALGSALGINLNSQMSHAMEATTGFSGKLNTAITDLMNSKVAVGTAQKALHAYWQEQLQVTGSVKGADTAVQLLTQRIMEGAVAAGKAAHESIPDLVGQLEQIGVKANLSQGQIATLIGQTMHMSREAVNAALAAHNAAGRVTDMGRAADDAANRLAGMGNNAQIATAKVATGVVQKLGPLPAKLRQIGEQSVQAIVGAINGGVGKAHSAAAAVSTGAISATSRMTPGFRSAGQNASAGAAGGILAGEGAVVSAAAQVADAATAAFQAHLHVHSPSTLTRQYGLWTVQGLINGLLAGQAKLVQTINDIMGGVKKAFQAGAITSWQDSALVRYVKADNAKLEALAKQRKAIAAQISAAKTYASNVKSSLTSYADLSGLSVVSNAGQSGSAPLTAAGILSGLKADLSKIQAFGHDIQKLKAAGLNKNMLNQIIQMGPAQGTQVAQALLAALSTANSANPGGTSKGGPDPGGPLGGGKLSGTLLPIGAGSAPGAAGIIAQLNAVQKQIDSASGKVATGAANAMYQAGASAAKGLAAGLKSQEKTIDDEMKKIADALVKRLKDDLKIHSPSEVMMEHGLMICQGLAKGIAAGRPMVETAMKSLAAMIAAMQPGGPIRIPVQIVPTIAGGGGSKVNPGGTMQAVNFNIHVAGSVVTERQLLDVVRDGVQHYLQFNPDNGLQRRGR